MDLDWSARQVALHERFRALSVPGCASEDGANAGSTGPDPGNGWKALAEAQVLALALPGEYGGLALDPITCAYALEGLGYGFRDFGLLFSVGAHMWAVELPLLRFGTPEQREAYLPGLARGELVGAHAITETETGSDALGLAATARRDGPTYVLNGRKRFVTNAPDADVFLVYATLGRQFGFTGVTAFLVDRDQAGVRVEAEHRKMGLRSCGWGQVVLEDCLVDESRRLGVEKQGANIFATAMAWERTLLLAPLLGAMERQIEECTAHVSTRRQFGRRLGSFAPVASRIVGMRQRLESARFFTRQAAWELARDEQTVFAEYAKLAVSEAAVAVFEDAMEIFGGYGYTEHAGIEERLRDVLGTRISSGTSDMQRTVIAAKLGLR